METTNGTVRVELKCPDCGFPMVLMESKETRYTESGRFRKYYRCVRFFECEGRCGAHPDGTPLGIPGDLVTRRLRRDLHEIFDQLWLSNRWSRKDAYRILEILTDLGEEDAHIGKFDKDLCGMVILRLREFLELNPPETDASGKPVRSRFVNVVRKCHEHGMEVHKIHLDERKKYCEGCWGIGLEMVEEHFQMVEKRKRMT